MAATSGLLAFLALFDEHLSILTISLDTTYIHICTCRSFKVICVKVASRKLVNLYHEFTISSGQAVGMAK